MEPPVDAPIVRESRQRQDLLTPESPKGLRVVQITTNPDFNNSHIYMESHVSTTSVDPLFADPDKMDFHLKSKTGRWKPEAKKWVKDSTTSPCIDAGDQKTDFSHEPAPNGGRVNMGAYGNTGQASKSAI